MFKRLQTLDERFQAIRLYALLLSSASVALGGYALFQSRKIVSEAQGRVFVLAPGQVYQAYAISQSEQLRIEARDHVRSFHEYFFSLDPDEKLIEANLKRALYLSDASAKQTYDLLKEKGYYAGLISGNISQRLLLDSLRVNVKTPPYSFRCQATQHIIRSSGMSRRQLVTEGKLRRVGRSEHNPHGFLIENWKILENTDLRP